MTPPPPLIGTNGRPFPLERQLASGGEGAVFTLPNDPNRLAKVYHPGRAQPIEKLTAMIAMTNARLTEVSAWPTELLLNARTRELAGLVMPRLIDFQPIQQLYNPVQRLKFFPRAGWTFQVRAARNLAAAFDEVHKAGCMIADVNQSNAFVSSQALVRLIDCDSFQVRANGKPYLCEVGVPHYTPPELQGKPLRGMARTLNHDRFGLAVLIYQLLFVGRHPYAGVYRGVGDPSFEQLITEFRFAQGPSARSWQMDPPPHTPTLADIPPEVGMLFRRAFERGSEKDNARPQATEWLPALMRLEQNNAVCAGDSGHQYWRGANKCTWCRLAEKGGPEYYFGVAGGIGSFVVDDARLREVLRRLSNMPFIEFPCNRTTYYARRSLIPTPIPADLVRLKMILEERKQKLFTDTREDQLKLENDDRIKRQNENEIRDKINGQLLERERILNLELEKATELVAIERREQRIIGLVLRTVTILGCLITLLGCYRMTLGVIGIVSSIVFGIWLTIHIARSRSTPAYRQYARIRDKQYQTRLKAEQIIRDAIDKLNTQQQIAINASEAKRRLAERAIREAEEAYERRFNIEFNARDSAVVHADEKLKAIEKTWSERSDSYRREHERIGAAIPSLVCGCRELASRYQVELNGLAAKAEATGRIRHMRLHLIADADIPKIGAGRKQTLASHGIFTAADVDEYKISAIKGFGEALTSNLIAWKGEVLREFRFNPATGVSPADAMLITVQFRTRQQQILAELDGHLTRLGSLATTYEAEIQKLVPQLKVAAAAWQQAEADASLVIANHLSNLAALLQMANRLAEAEPLSRRAVMSCFEFTHRNRHEHPHLQTVLANYRSLLKALGRSEAQIHEEIEKLKGELA
jgi:DNA-binding helix-hairpin-helix protein with protein kinase domain